MTKCKKKYLRLVTASKLKSNLYRLKVLLLEKKIYSFLLQTSEESALTPKQLDHLSSTREM